jgi:uncharacterized membrane protein
METVVFALHVVAAVFIVGPMAILPMTAMRAVRSGQGGQVAVLAQSTFVFSLLSLLVAVLGFGVLGLNEEGTTISTPWVLSSIILYVVALALNLIAVVPALRSAAEHLQDSATQELQKPDYRRITIGSGVVTVLLVVITVLMAWHPGSS